MYLDSSFIIALSLEDAFTDRSRDLLLSIVEPLIVSDWATLEVSTVITKRARIGAISNYEVTILLNNFDVWRETSTHVQTADISAATTFVRSPNIVLRGPDAVHIAMAQRLNAQLLTFDKGMSKAAAQLGLALAC